MPTGHYTSHQSLGFSVILISLFKDGIQLKQDFTSFVVPHNKASSIVETRRKVDHPKANRKQKTRRPNVQTVDTKVEAEAGQHIRQSSRESIS